MNIYLTNRQEKALAAYRVKRRAETGKVLHSTTAVSELLDKALEGIEPVKPVEDRLTELERRVAKLEGEKHA